MSNFVFKFPLELDDYQFFVDGQQKTETLCIKRISTGELFFCELVSLIDNEFLWIKKCFRNSKNPFSKDEEKLFSKWASLIFQPCLSVENKTNWSVALDVFFSLKSN